MEIKNRQGENVSLEQIKEHIEAGGWGMLHTGNWKYEIDGVEYIANSLTIANESIPFERDGKIIVPTYFRRYMLAQPTRGNGNAEDLVKVEVVVEPEGVTVSLAPIGE